MLSPSHSSFYLLLEACAVPVQEAIYVQDLRLRHSVLVLECFRAQCTHQHMLLELWADILNGLEVPVAQPRCQRLLSCSQQVLQASSRPHQLRNSASCSAHWHISQRSMQSRLLKPANS